MANPIDQAISARIRLALIHYRRGEMAEMAELLEQLERVLPLPERNNWDAAKDCARRAAKRKSK